MKPLILSLLLYPFLVNSQISHYFPEEVTKNLSSSQIASNRIDLDSMGYVGYVDRGRLIMFANLEEGISDRYYNETLKAGKFTPAVIDSGYHIQYTVVNVNNLLITGNQDQSLIIKSGKPRKTNMGVVSHRVRDRERLKSDYRENRFRRDDQNSKIARRTYKTSRYQTAYEYKLTPVICRVQEKYVCFNEEIDRFVVLDRSGEVVNQRRVNIRKPLVYSRKDKKIFIDYQKKKFYIMIRTNFGYNWYQLDIETGKTKLVTKIDGVWPNPNWKVQGGVLFYEKVKNNAVVKKTIVL